MPLLVWSDSPELTANLYGSYGVGARHTFFEPGIIKRIFISSFERVTTTGYRPLNFVVHKAGVAFFSTPELSPYLWFAAVSIIVGCTAVCFFLVARRYTRTDTGAVLAVFLLLCSPPVIGTGWLIFSGIHALVLLLISLGFLIYWKLIDSLHHRTWYLLSLCAVLLLGPWYREFVGGISILIIFLEVRRARRPTTLAGLAGLFFLHAVFPTALVKLVAFPELPLRPVFALGQLGVQIQRVPHSAGLSAMSEVLASLRWQAVCTFLLLLPPTALGLALLGYLIPNYWQENRINPSESSYAASGGVLFLAVWTLVFLVPFLKVFTLHAHLAYPLMPFSILTAIGIERLCYVVWQQNHFGQFLRYSLGLVLIIGVGDHLLNIYGSYRTVHGINDGNLAVANWFKTHVPKGSIVISNALHVEDIRLFSNGHIIPYWTVDTGIVEMKRAVETTAKLEELLGQNKNLHEIYFLDVNYNFTPDKVYYHSHKYVRNESVEMKNLGLIQTIRVRYPYLDPLRAFTPRSYILFLGGGDLENDFYHGPAQDGTPFLREIYAEYHVYQATGTEVAPWDPNVPWSFVESGFEGFNIFQYGDRYLGIAQRLGPVDLHWLNRRLVRDFRAQGGFVIGQSLNEVKGLVSQLVAAQRVHDASVPILVEAAYRGFNLVQYQDRVYAIPQGEGAFEIERIKRNQYTHWFAGASAEEVKGLVAASVAKD